MKVSVCRMLFSAFSLTLALTVLAQSNPSSTENAKKDGEVIWYGSLTGGTIVARIIKAFEDKYPPIKVKYLRMGGAGLIERIRSEARTGRFLWDVATAEYIQFFQLPKHVNLAKYFTPEFQKFAEPHRDPNGTWISIYGAIATIGWNTRMVKPADAPKGLEESVRAQVERKENRPACRSLSMVRRDGRLSGRQGRP
jgi:ABC-type glycerol-3-phosphate transport system substrate-binding protein